MPSSRHSSDTDVSRWAIAANVGATLTAGPNRARAALPGRRPQPAGRDHHLLEHVAARPRRLRQAQSQPRNPDRVPSPRLAPGLGTHQPDRRVPLANHRIHGPRETLNVGFRPLPQTTPSRSRSAMPRSRPPNATWTSSRTSTMRPATGWGWWGGRGRGPRIIGARVGGLR